MRLLFFDCGCEARADYANEVVGSFETALRLRASSGHGIVVQTEGLDASTRNTFYIAS